MEKLSPEPVALIKKRRNEALSQLIDSIPYISFLGVDFDRRGDEITAILPFKEELIGNPSLPALHGGSIAAFLEISAIIGLSWTQIWHQIEDPGLGASSSDDAGKFTLPKTIDFSVDYLRSGLPRDSYARAKVNRAGRRYASVHVEAWQDNRDRLFAQGTGHFLMPQPN
tara:strand:+ start:243 stop:749 length:507 start_codon:yes stop_codon:yes gene_type:complete